MFKAQDFEKVRIISKVPLELPVVIRNCGNNPYTEVKICINTKKKMLKLEKKKIKKENSNSLNLNEVMPRH